MVDLRQHSLDVITTNQAAGGAYIACPNMPDYAYCWFRDGAFIAYAMDVAGEHESARRFYQWGADVINRRADVVHRAVGKAGRGAALLENDYLHTRYTLDGREGDDGAWPNFQLDGIGTWLWGMAQHKQLRNLPALPDDWTAAAQLAAAYLAALWRYPNYDLWEEFGDQIHPYTLGAIYAGLRAHAFLGESQGTGNGYNYDDVAASIRDFVLEKGTARGRFVKYLGATAVDASLLALSVPYGLVDPHDDRMQATVEAIERDLRHHGGLRRYAGDSYYGGGEWLLLAAWLGWYYRQLGNRQRAQTLLAWVASQSDACGNMPEQTPVHLNAPDYLQKWIEIRGPIANPLLWSHAMYLILDHALDAPRSAAFSPLSAGRRDGAKGENGGSDV